MSDIPSKISQLLISHDLFHKASQNPILKSFFQIIDTSRRGWLYGSRLRLAHSLTLLIIFSRIHSLEDLRHKLSRVIINSQKHGLSLSCFAGLYKLSLAVLKRNQEFGTNGPVSHFISAFVSGYLVYGNQFGFFSNGISQQITLYVMSRVILGIARLLGEKISVAIYRNGLNNDITKFDFNTIKNIPEFKKINNELSTHAWNLTAATSWAAILVLWNYRQDVLNTSVVHSMDYIYNNYNFSNFMGFIINNDTKK
ncbi:hypothetical protein DASC09_030490 [Saccharomycopsis crataegensis]|uniref:Peroxisomal membrane protein 4 n=1 Tax=Saccharomycopsis crataegensis TaxID=43959 RepID=A0AAV5QLW6_9ASCO|nr:hypothetical protein DASC09_030490 [Saccharomycopsis crataegensis]